MKLLQRMLQVEEVNKHFYSKRFLPCPLRTPSMQLLNCLALEKSSGPGLCLENVMFCQPRLRGSPKGEGLLLFWGPYEATPT